MKLRSALIFLPLCFGWTSGCGGPLAEPGTRAALPNTSAPYLNVGGPNVLPLQIGPSSICGKKGYENEPCTTVTVCVPGTSNCKTIPDVLVDTGSVGLRVFTQALGLTLPPQTAADGNPLAQCAQFGTGQDWGPVEMADIVLAGEPPVTAAIQVIDHGYSKSPPACSQSDTDPIQAGFNGILGVGLFNEDCGTHCAQKSNGVYYSCGGSASGSGTCASVGTPPALQLKNPVALLPQDNNGFLLALPQIGSSGATSAAGSLILGISTQPNNSPQGVSAYQADANGNFTTQIEGIQITTSFIDSGSNGLFFPLVPELQDCPSGPTTGFFCPSSDQNLHAVTTSSVGGGAATVPFTISNAQEIVSSGNYAVSTLGGDNAGIFDWGLPFFYGRAVFIGIEGKSSPLGIGPHWAY